MSTRYDNSSRQDRPEAWTIDAHSYSDAGQVSLIHSTGTDRFLAKENVFGVVAAKGMGKTLLLKRKSDGIRARERGVFLPQHEPCEKFDRLTHDFSRDSVKQYSTAESWKLLWCTAIASAVLYRVGGRLPAALRQICAVEVEMEKACGERRPLSIESTLSSLLASSYPQFKGLYATELKASLSTLADNVFVFLDNIDEALEKHVGDSLRSFERTRDGDWRQGALSAEVWTNAQLGLLAAMRDLHFASRRLRVYAALRKEAIARSKTALTLQETDLCVFLKCPKPLAEKIFIANIDYLGSKDLVRTDAEDPYVRFLGWNEIHHLQRERAFDFVYRHTLGRPRELLEVGKAITAIPTDERDAERVREVVRGVARRLLEQYKLEVIPFWDERYDELLKLIDSNVLPERTVLRCFAEMRREFPDVEHPFTYFLNRGLVGRLIQSDREQVISFSEVGTYAGAGVVDIGSSHYFFLHPCMESVVLSCNANFSVDARQIVGNGVPFALQPESDVLHIACSSMDRFLIEYRGIAVDVLQTNRSVAAPMFIAIAAAVALAQSRRVQVETVIEAARDLVGAGLLSPTRDGEDITEFIRGRLNGRNGKLTKRGGREVLGLSQVLRRQGHHLEGAWCTCTDGILEFALCEPSKIDAVQLLNKLQRNRSRRARTHVEVSPTSNAEP